MVLPIIVAGARVAGSTAVRAGSTAVRTGAKATKSSAQNIGRQITRTRRTSSSASLSEVPTSSNVVRSRATDLRQGLSNNAESVDSSQSSYSASSQNSPVKYRINIVVGIILVYVALMFDVLELALDFSGTAGFGVLVVIGYIKDAMSLVFFPAVFLLLGAPFWKGRKAKKKMITMLSGYIIAFLPWIGAIMPETLIAVTVTILLTRSEDRQTSSTGDLKRNIVRARRLTRRLNN